MTSLSLEGRERLERIAADWREAAGYGRPVELSAHEASELAGALTSVLHELDRLQAEIAGMTGEAKILVVTEI
jgi:hypothetical protein